MTTIECLLLATGMSLLTSFILKKEPAGIKYPVAVFILFAVSLNMKKTVNWKTNELIVYNNPANPATGIRRGNTLQLFTNRDSIPVEVLRHTSAMGLRIKLISCNNKSGVFKVGNNKILLTDSLINRRISNIEPDIIILTGNRPFVEKAIKPSRLPGTIIISSEAAQGFHLPFNPEELANKTIRYVRKSGAYITSL